MFCEFDFPRLNVSIQLTITRNESKDFQKVEGRPPNFQELRELIDNLKILERENYQFVDEKNFKIQVADESKISIKHSQGANFKVSIVVVGIKAEEPKTQPTLVTVKVNFGEKNETIGVNSTSTLESLRKEIWENLGVLEVPIPQ